MHCTFDFIISKSHTKQYQYFIVNVDMQNDDRTSLVGAVMFSEQVSIAT